ncbi:F-box protein [Quillaja saponaria]|uniref:F-box protein n=1 Tax=Quillaja saponaria TaxID=32244 RepID=A0AAD7VHT7_QUISA|nr:F-box protein [Quillaja saponaria]
MACSSFSDSKTTSATVNGRGATLISAIHPEIIQTHILTLLDGPTLASAASTSSQLYSLSSQEDLWANICRSTWPSTDTPRLRRIISTFAHELISAVDVYYKGKLVFSKVVETETLTGWFKCSPFRVDLLDPKDVVPTPIKYPNGEDACGTLGEDLTLSWILIDPTGRRAMNISSHKPVSVERHWLSREVQVRFSSILAGEKGSPSEFVQCVIVVTCGGLEGGDIQIREVSLQMEDMDGTHLNGRESLVILQMSLEGKKRRETRREEEGRKRYQEYLKMKEERKERKLRAEGTLDMLCVFLAVLSFAGFGLFVLWR